MAPGRRFSGMSRSWQTHRRSVSSAQIEQSEEVRACLEHLKQEARELIMEAFTLTDADLSRKDIRDRLAARLGISRNTLDQRISRALRRIRARMRHRPGWNRR